MGLVTIRTEDDGIEGQHQKSDFLMDLYQSRIPFDDVLNMDSEQIINAFGEGKAYADEATTLEEAMNKGLEFWCIQPHKLPKMPNKMTLEEAMQLASEMDAKEVTTFLVFEEIYKTKE